MMKKINKAITRMPLSILVAITAVFAFAAGTIDAKTNLTFSSMLNGYAWSTLLTLITLYLISLLLEGMCKIFNKGFHCKLANRVYTENLEKVSKAKMSSINKLNSGKTFGLVATMSDYTGQVWSVAIYLVSVIPPFAVLMFKEWQYNKLMVLVNVLSLAISSFMYAASDKIFGWSTEGQKARGRIAGVTADNFNNIRTIKRLDKTQFAKSRLLNAQEEALQFGINIPKIIYMRFADMAFLAPLLVNVYLARESLAMISLLVVSNSAVHQMQNIISTCLDMKVEIDGCKKNLAPIDEVDDTNRKVLYDSFTLNNIVFDYGNEEVKFIIDQPLTFPYKSKTLVYGESGEGKSSLANLITGAIHPTVGTVPAIECFYIWQETEALDDTLWNNIVFDNSDNVSEEEIIELFKALNMLEWFNKLEQGFETVIGEKGCRISSGQKQRLNIIRLILAFRYHPEFLFIIDEITSNLDSKTRDLAIKLINKECHSTLICISHNEGFDQICEHAILVEDHHFKVMK